MMTDLIPLGAFLVEKLARAVCVYVFLVIAFRLAGKRLLAQLNPFDLVLLLVISNAVQNAIVGSDDSVAGGLLSAGVLLVVNELVIRTTFRIPRLDSLLESSATTLIDNGSIDDGALRAERITRMELRTALHKQGLELLDEVKTAAIEPGGAIWFERRSPSPDELRHRELMERLDRIEERLRG